MTSRLAALVVLASMLAAGCAHPAADDASRSPGPVDARLVSLDGRWLFDADLARDVLAPVGLGVDSIGAVLRGEAALATHDRAAAGDVLALDERAASLLGGLALADGGAASLPRAGDVLLSRNASIALGARVGDVVDLTADAWPESRVTVWREMEFVHPCGSAQASNPCALPPTIEGAVSLLLTLPSRTVQLAFHPDVNELRDGDYPATWTGTFTSPSGHATPFSTFATTPSELGAPGAVDGAPTLEDGPWTIEFRLVANGTPRSIPAAGSATPIAGGLVTIRAPGFDAYDLALEPIPTAAEQTRAILANATPHARHGLRVAGVLASGGAARALGASAIVSMEDARALLGAGARDASLLVLPGSDASSAVRADDALANATDARVHALRVRSALVAAPALGDAPDTRALVLRAPASLDPSALPRVAGVGAPILTVEGTRAPGANETVGERAESPFRRLALPAGALPGALVPGGAWGDLAEAIANVTRSPNLALVSEDLAVAAGLSPSNVTYAPIVLDGATGRQSYNLMAALRDGPSRTVWVAPSLLSAIGSPRGARIVVPIEPGADPTTALAAVASAWRPYGVAPVTSD